MAIKTTNSSLKVYQYLDLKEEFGIDFKKKPDLRNKVAQILIDEMKDRISDGIDINGKPFKKYSEAYKKSIEFKAARKTGKVNMFLSGDMLGDIDILNENSKTNTIKIGFNDREQELKAHGHQTGAVGVQREFFGISDRDIQNAKSKIKDLIE